MQRFALVLATWVTLHASASQASNRQWLSDDFFIDTLDASTFFTTPQRLTVTDCRAQIAKATCVATTRFRREGGDTLSRACSKDSAKYVAFFEAVYDRFPAPLQQMFCSVTRIMVEPQMESIAYATLRGGGAVIGFRQSVIDEGLDLSTVLSWKEQLPFGGVRDSYDIDDSLPREWVRSLAAPAQDLAFYVLAHEFGHLFDFANDLSTSCFPGGGCTVQPGTFTALSWKTTSKPKKSEDFPHRAEVCYYNCSRAPLQKSAVNALYAGLYQSGFITLYAGTNIYDDLAESLAFYMLDQTGGFSFSLDTRQNNTYDLLAKVHAPQFAAKLRYLNDFLQSDIIYP